CVVFSRDSRWLYSAGDKLDPTIKVWDPTTGKLERTLPGHTAMVHRMVFNKQGTRLASVAIDRTLRVWDPATGKEVRSWESPNEASMSCLDFSPDGRTVVTGGEGSSSVIRFWDIETGLQPQTGVGHMR